MKRFTLFFTCLFLSLGMALAQQKTISGIVISAEDGEPIIGASVVAKGLSGVGAQTNLDGKFSFSAPTSLKTIIVSYVGMQTQEVAAGKDLRIVLKPTAVQLEGVVVTGMGIKRSQKSLGYSVQQVKAEELQTTRTTDVNNALAGKIAGARFMGGSGATFDAGSIVLRGTSNLSPGGSEPIYVVDGVITNKNMVNMDDVASLNVLKGPAATAVYGSEGGNGAIIIQTRGGGNGSGDKAQMSVDFSHTTTFEKPVNYFDFQQEYGGGYMGANAEMPIYKWKDGHDPAWKVLDGKRYYDYANDASWGPKLDGGEYIPFYAWDKTDPRFGKTALWKAHGKDNILALFRTGMTNTTNVAFARAEKNHSTRVSFTNIGRRGIYQNSDAVRRFLSVKTNFRPMEHLIVDLDYKYTYRENHNAATEEYGGYNPVYSFTQWGHVNVDINDLKENYIRPDGSYRSWNIRGPKDFTPAYHNNPFAMMDFINRYSRYTWNVFSATAAYEITNKIKAQASVFGNVRSQQSEVQIGYNFTSDDLIPYYYQEQNRTKDIRTQGKVSYTDRFLQDQLTLDAAIYAENRDFRYDVLKANTTDGLAADKWFNLASSVGKPKAENLLDRYQVRSVYGTLTLGWQDTYFADFSARNDWSSTLPDKHNGYFFGGASVAAIASNWIPKNNILNFWKIRASAAQVGSTLNPYNVYQTYETSKYGTTTWAYNSTTLKNTEIKPTISTSFEVGTEFRMFNNRLWGDINYYNRIARDQILALNMAPASGFVYRYINAGRIQNKGIEIALGGSPIKTQDWQWDVNFNIARNRNKLLELDGERNDYRVSWYSFGSRASLYAIVGEPVGTIIANNFKYDEQGRQVFHKKEITATEPEKIEKQQKDIEVNGPYTPLISADQKLGNVQPDFTGGFNTSLRWKNLSLRASFDFQIGGNILSVSNMFGEGSGLTSSTVGKNDRGVDVREDLSKNGGVHIVGVDENGNAVDSHLEANYYFGNFKSGVWGAYLYDASYVKMRELAISYEFPKDLIMKTGFLKSASISLVANNPWLIYSAVPNFDVSEAVNAYQGYCERGQTVSSRTIGFTVNLTF